MNKNDDIDDLLDFINDSSKTVKNSKQKDDNKNKESKGKEKEKAREIKMK